MLRKKYFILLSVVGVVFLSTIFASAQISNVTGTVEVEKEGKREVVEGALVEIYRIDVTSGNKSDTTDKRGNFKFIGVPPGASYLLTVSGEGLEPAIIKVTSGTEGRTIVMNPGDGTRWTEEQVRSSLSAQDTSNLTAEQRKELEELEKKRAEIEAKNQKAGEFNAIINRAAKEGEAAYKDKNYDLAIVKFQEGYEAGPDFLGSAPGFLNNKALVLLQRAVSIYNDSVKSKDAAEKATLKQKAAKDFEEALSAVGTALNLLMTGDTSEVKPTVVKAARANSLQYGQELIEKMNRTELTSDVVKEEAKLVTSEFIKDESDKAKKLKAQLDLAVFLTRVFDYDGSVVAYRKALEMDAKNPDALSGLGVSLYLASEVNGDAAQKQEGLNYMQYYLDKAPKDHSFRESVEGIVEELKAQKMKPQKISMN